jgi:hypothetical protein
VDGTDSESCPITGTSKHNTEHYSKTGEMIQTLNGTDNIGHKGINGIIMLN